MRARALITLSRSRLKPASAHSYTAPSAPALTSRLSSGDQTILRTFPLWPLPARRAPVMHGHSHRTRLCV